MTNQFILIKNEYLKIKLIYRTIFLKKNVCFSSNFNRIVYFFKKLTLKYYGKIKNEILMENIFDTYIYLLIKKFNELLFFFSVKINTIPVRFANNKKNQSLHIKKNKNPEISSKTKNLLESSIKVINKEINISIQNYYILKYTTASLEKVKYISFSFIKEIIKKKNYMSVNSANYSPSVRIFILFLLTLIIIFHFNIYFLNFLYCKYEN
nr:hypothetical protein 1634Bnrm2_p152 [Cryptomonas sp.]